MVRLIQFGLTPKDRPSKRILFSGVTIGQCFYHKGYWWQRRTAYTARRADCDDNDSTRFSKRTYVYVLVEDEADNADSLQRQQLRELEDQAFARFIAPSAVED
jgi:hypothetical protein